MDILYRKYLENSSIPDKMATENEFLLSALENCHVGPLGS